MPTDPATEPVSSRLSSVHPADLEVDQLAGRVAGALFVLASLTLAAYPLLPSPGHFNLPWVSALAGAGFAWGMTQLVLGWRRMHPWLIQVSGLAGLVLTVAAIAATGGADSLAWIYLIYVVVFAAWFSGPRVAALYVLGALAVQISPLLYGSAASHTHFFPRLLLIGPAYPSAALALVLGKQMMLRVRRRAEALAAQQGALRRVATAVVSGEAPERIYDSVARELAELHGGVTAGILRLQPESRAMVMGAWPRQPGGGYTPGSVVPVLPGGDIERAARTGRPSRVEASDDGTPLSELGYRSSIVAPINVDGRTWGVLALLAVEPGALTLADEERLTDFGDLLSTAIASIEDRAKLAAQASSDPLTGLANHRTLQERLAAEVSRAVRHALPLSVAVIDIDQFKLFNDTGGHEAGDRILVRLARCLSSLARAEDVLGRIGGDEFAWVMPETEREQALVAVERARTLLARSDVDGQSATVSAGICDISVTSDPAELLRFADGALYWSKAHGRDQCWVYDASVVEELSAQERADHLERSHALLGLRALARAIDAKDPATRQHSERVSSLVGRLSTVAGWPEDRVRRLSEAALVHDVGKIGVPDAVLRKTEPLTAEERALIVHHAELSARIVDGVLAPDQVEWIRMHHERPDGQGYPDGLERDGILEGAALLSIADAYDVMTVSRPYSLPKTSIEAVAEIASLVDQQFTAAGVRALLTLHARGELEGDLLGTTSAA